MSAFVVNAETIAAIMRGLDHATAKHETRYMGFRIPRRPPTGLPDRDEALSRLGDALWAMNNEAVNQRYNATDAAPSGYRHQHNIKSPTPAEWVQIWQQCERFDYQCCEGDVPDSANYRDWQEIQLKIADAAIMQGKPAHVQDY